MRVVRDDGTEAAPGEVGEVAFRIEGIHFAGYIDDDEANAAAVRDGWFLTGDLGYFDEDGYFFLVDRVKRMINASGFKVWPAEVENMMYAHPAIQEACVIGIEDPYRGESVKAFVVLKPASRGGVTDAEIIAWCRANMAAYKVPQQIEFRDALPKSGAGKLLWRVLQDEEQARHGAGGPAAAEGGRR
jgi:fatty-acyl-CoA synthase